MLGVTTVDADRAALTPHLLLNCIVHTQGCPPSKSAWYWTDFCDVSVSDMLLETVVLVVPEIDVLVENGPAKEKPALTEFFAECPGSLVFDCCI